ncbi:MAG: biotin transporter BioY [Actinomycetota bacterium]|nr:biotin transporter BioY [Actinomycetota bacterium]
MRSQEWTCTNRGAATVAGIVLFAALTALGSHIKLPLSPVPFTMQVFFVILSGLVLGPMEGAASQLAFIVAGLVGAPFFASPPHAGPAVLLGPTGGYLLGFVIASYISGHLARRGAPTFVAGLAGLAAIYICGFSWLSVQISSASAAWEIGIKPFLVADLLKVAGVTASLPGWNIMPVAGRSSGDNGR